MRLNEALQSHIDQQFNKGYYPTKDELMSDNRQVVISREVGSRVSSRMGELVSYGTFDNCREHGITFQTPDSNLSLKDGWTFCVYEHRNSDEICVEGCPTSEVESYGPYGGENKYDTLFSTRYMDYDGAADAICDALTFVATTPNVTRQSVRDHLPASVSR